MTRLTISTAQMQYVHGRHMVRRGITSYVIADLHLSPFLDAVKAGLHLDLRACRRGRTAFSTRLRSAESSSSAIAAYRQRLVGPRRHVFTLPGMLARRRHIAHHIRPSSRSPRADPACCVQPARVSN